MAVAYFFGVFCQLGADETEEHEGQKEVLNQSILGFLVVVIAKLAYYLSVYRAIFVILSIYSYLLNRF